MHILLDDRKNFKRGIGIEDEKHANTLEIKKYGNKLRWTSVIIEQRDK